ncbi:MAG: hypothetical protein LBG19_07500 [Prevotellaceae bacterium]|nr:hypothetical protein [Prevotellaceae bacterium]
MRRINGGQDFVCQCNSDGQNSPYISGPWEAYYGTPEGVIDAIDGRCKAGGTCTAVRLFPYL